MKIILKLNIVRDIWGRQVSDTVHIPIGEKIILKENESIVSVEFDDVKMIYTAKDCE